MLQLEHRHQVRSIEEEHTQPLSQEQKPHAEFGTSPLRELLPEIHPVVDLWDDAAAAFPEDADFNKDAEALEYVKAFGAVDALIDILDEYDPDHKLADPEFRKQLIFNSSPLEFAYAAASINQLLMQEHAVQIPKSIVGIVQRTNDSIKVNTIGIDPELRSDVFETAVNTAKKLAANDDLDGAGKVIANTIVGMQIFKNGNKRTGRAMYQLIAHGYDGNADDFERLHDTLGFTYEAKNSFHYGTLDPALRWSYLLDTLHPNEVQPYIELEKDWQSIREDDFLYNSLSNISDIDKRGKVVQILEQLQVGAHRVVLQLRNAGKIPQNGKITKQVLAEYLHTLDNAGAQEIIDSDITLKQDYLKRAITSVIGEDVIPYHDMSGNKFAAQRIEINGR